MTPPERPPRAPKDRMVSVTINVPPRAYDVFCRQAAEKQQSLSAFLRTAVLKNISPKS